MEATYKMISEYTGLSLETLSNCPINKVVDLYNAIKDAEKAKHNLQVAIIMAKNWEKK